MKKEIKEIKEMRELAYNLSEDTEYKEAIAIMSDNEVRELLLKHGFTREEEK